MEADALLLKNKVEVFWKLLGFERADNGLLKRRKNPLLCVAPMIDQSELAYRMFIRHLVESRCALVSGPNPPLRTAKPPKVVTSGTEGSRKKRRLDAPQPWYTPVTLVGYTPMIWADRLVAAAPVPKKSDNGVETVLGNVAGGDGFSTCAGDRPLIVQLAGHNPAQLAAAAALVAPLCDAVDLNLGCPQPVADRQNIGAFLVERDPDLVAKCVSSMNSAAPVPITCKMRIQESVETSVRVARQLQDAGCALLCVHGRTCRQGRSGEADWAHIRAIKVALDIPVVANGSMQTPTKLRECLAATQADGALVAEPLLIDPMLFVEFLWQTDLAARGGEGHARSGPSVAPADGARVARERWNQIDLALEYFEFALRYPCSASYKRVREHMLHVLGYRRRSFHCFTARGSWYKEQFMLMNSKLKVLRQKLYKQTNTLEELHCVVSQLHGEVHRVERRGERG